ncbi:MAG TPA: hypothetical protein GXZ89_05535 [Fastidiosipila sp.]|nr:hypothetical protein [Fastidiosipila sp.]
MTVYDTKAQSLAVLVLDETKEYARRLAAGLEKRADCRLHMTVSDSLEQIDERTLSSLDVCLFSHKKTDALATRRWSNDTRFFLLCDTNGPNKVSRYSPLSDIVNHIFEDIASIARPVPLVSRHGTMEMVICFDRSLRDRYIERRLDDIQKRGCTPYFLPLMPTYLVPHAEPGGPGPTLSDLLLTLAMNDDSEDADLGQVFFLHSSGYLQPRPPEQADDLITASADTLYRLVKLMRRRIDKSGEDGFALIACDSLPLETVSHIAAHCDSLTLDRETVERSGLSKSELHRMLASLPSSCDVRDIGTGEMR